MAPTDDPLATGAIEVIGRMPWSSNATFLVEVTGATGTARAIYKPVRGERPLWDFPPGLHRRERAAWVLSEALGWSLVPHTVLRDDAPAGMGSLQRFVDADFAEHYFTIVGDPAFEAALRRLCAFDIVINATDRKAGHVLVDADGGIWAIDNGLSFHAESKLRTVIWDFAGEPVPADVLEDLCRFDSAPTPPELVELLAPDELEALGVRLRGLVRSGVFPTDHTGRRVPWPLV